MDRAIINASVTAASAAIFAASWVAVIHADTSAAQAQASTLTAPANAMQQGPASTAPVQATNGSAVAAPSTQLVPAPAVPLRARSGPVRRSRAS